MEINLKTTPAHTQGNTPPPCPSGQAGFEEEGGEIKNVLTFLIFNSRLTDVSRAGLIYHF